MGARERHPTRQASAERRAVVRLPPSRAADLAGRDGASDLEATLARYDAARRRTEEAQREEAAVVRDLRRLMTPGSRELGSPTGEPDRIATFVVALRAACAERRLRVTGDGAVAEADAAALLGRRPSTLRGWRGTHRPIPFIKAPTGRVVYRLDALAAYLARSEEIG